MNILSILQCRVVAPARQPLRAGALVVAAFWGSADAEVRAWTNTAGQSFQAELVRVDGANVIFAFNDGRTFSTPLSSLGASDQALVRQAAAAQPATVQPPNFGYPWPREIRVDGASQSKVVSEDAKTGVYVYESPHYRFTCNVRLTSDVLRNFAMMFETTRKYVTTVPLELDGGAVRHGKLDVQLFETMEAYVRGGGGPGTAACYVPARGAVLAPLESLGLLKTSTGFSLDMKRTNAVLIHELTHQLTPLSYMVSTLGNGWFIEGMAEYIASSPYSWGYFRSDPHGNAVLAYVTAHGEDRKGGRVLGKKLRVPRLRQLMQMEYRHFAGANANLHYGAGLLLTHYFLHMEGGGKAIRITDYLKGLRAGRTGEAAIAPLLGGGSFEKLETEFAEAWRKKGLEIAFE